MLDVELDAPTKIDPGRREETLQHPSSSQTPVHSARSASRRIQPLRGFKRPRRNVVNRSIATLTDFEEDKETLLGIDTAEKRYGFRASRVALALFCLVCSTGVYRGVSEFLIDRKATATTVTKKGLENVDPTHPFRGSQDGEHREALIHGEGKNDTAQNIEDIPAIIFDETIVVPQLSNLANIFHEQYNPHQNKLFIWHIPRSGTTTIKRIASYCMGLTIASEAGKSEMAGSNQELRIVEGMDGAHFAAIDLSSPAGIALAKTLNVGQSEKIDLVSS